MRTIAIALVVLSLGCASGLDPVENAPLVVLEEEADGSHWRATWYLPEPTSELLFERPAGAFRSDVFEVLTPGFSFTMHGEQEVLRTEASPVSEISVRFPEYSEWLQKEYEFFQSFSDGSVAIYTGHLVARPLSGEAADCDDCFVRSFRFLSHDDATPVVVDGRVERSPVSWTDESGQGSYVYFGSIEPVATAEMISIVDPGLPDWLEDEADSAFPRLFALYTDRFAVELPDRPTVLFSYEESDRSGYSSGGGTLPGQIQLTVQGRGWEERSDDAMIRLFQFLAHEAVHLWNGQIVQYPDSEDSWMHEGSADALAQRTLLELGLIDESAFLEEQTSALNECLRGLEGFPLREAAERGAFQLYYRCGNMLALLTEQTLPEHDLFGFWRELIDHAMRQDGHYDVEDYLKIWRELGGDRDAVESAQTFVATEAHAGQLVGMLSQNGVAIVEDPDPPQTYGQSVSRDALLVLMQENCRGRYGFNASQRGFELDDELECGPVPDGGIVTKIGRRDVLREGHRTWDWLHEQCGPGALIEVDVRADEATSTIELRCSSPVPARPAFSRIVSRDGSTGLDRSEEEIQKIERQSKRLSDAYVRGEIEELVAIYASDGVAIPGGRDAFRGRDELLALWSLPEGRTILRHEAKPVEIAVDGDLAYDWGHYEGQAAQDGEPLEPFRGIYTIVWTRDEAGVWRIAVDMWHGLRSD